MLQPNQLKAIKDHVNSGVPLPWDIASALLAGYESAEALRAANQIQIGVLQVEKSTLIWERDETLRIKREIELEIDQRVATQTRCLQTEKEDAQYKAADAERRAEYLRRELEEFQEFRHRDRRRGAQVIRELQQVVERRLPSGWWTNLMWNRSAKRAVKRVDELLSPTELDQWADEESPGSCRSKTQTLAEP